MRSTINRHGGELALTVVFLFALICAANFAAQPSRDLAFKPPASPDQSVRVMLVRKSFSTLPAGAKDLEIDFTGANGIVTRLSATNGKQTFKFERADDAELELSTGQSQRMRLVKSASRRQTYGLQLPTADAGNADERTYSAGETGRSTVDDAGKCAAR